MRQLRISATAQADLDEIWLFIAQDDPGAADRFLERLLHACGRLIRAPRMGRLREDLASDLRSLSFGHYLVFYRPTDSDIEIVRVLSGFRDIEEIFGR